jgi:hypothetical protein
LVMVPYLFSTISTSLEDNPRDLIPNSKMLSRQLQTLTCSSITPRKSLIASTLANWLNHSWEAPQFSIFLSQISLLKQILMMICFRKWIIFLLIILGIQGLSIFLALSNTQRCVINRVWVSQKESNILLARDQLPML